MSAHVLRLSSTRTGAVYEVSGKSDAGYLVYYYVLVDKLKEALVARMTACGSLNLYQLGTVLYSGLGQPNAITRARGLSMLKENKV